jgi:hypothetical protein
VRDVSRQEVQQRREGWRVSAGQRSREATPLSERIQNGCDDGRSSRCERSVQRSSAAEAPQRGIIGRQRGAAACGSDCVTSSRARALPSNEETVRPSVRRAPPPRNGNAPATA